MFVSGETVILHRYSGARKNSLGQTIPSYEDIELEDVAVFNGATAFTSASDEIIDGDSIKVSSGKRLITMEIIEVSSQDKVTVKGVKYDVDGDGSGPRINPFTGDSFGTKIRLKRVTGG